MVCDEIKKFEMDHVREFELIKERYVRSKNDGNTKEEEIFKNKFKEVNKSQNDLKKQFDFLIF